MQPEHTLGPINQHELQDDKNIDDVGQRIRNIEMFGQSSLNMINPGLGIEQSKPVDPILLNSHSPESREGSREKNFSTPKAKNSADDDYDDIKAVKKVEGQATVAAFRVEDLDASSRQSRQVKKVRHQDYVYDERDEEEK